MSGREELTRDDAIRCPHCNGDATAAIDDPNDYVRYAVVGCMECPAGVRTELSWADDEAEVFRSLIAAWNRRATPSPAAEADLEAIQGRLKHLESLGVRVTVIEEDALIDLRTLLAEVARLRAREAELVAALRAMLNHSCVADAGGDMKDAEDHAAERRARALINGGSDG